MAQLAYRPADVVLHLLVGLPGAGHHAHRAALSGKGHAVEGGADLGEEVQLALFQQEEQEGLQFLLTGQRGGGTEQFFLLGGGDSGTGETLPERLVVQHRAAGGFYALGGAARQSKEGGGIALDLFFHAPSPASFKKSSTKARSLSLSRRLPATWAAARRASWATS